MHRVLGQFLLAAALGLALVTTSTSSAQQIRTTDIVSQYVDGLLEQTPHFEETWNELTTLISYECAAVARSDREGLREELKWLGTLINRADGRIKRAVVDIKSSRLALKNGRPTREAAEKSLKHALVRLSDARMRSAVTALVMARVVECMETRLRVLDGGTWMTGTWWAKCSVAHGITPANYGRLTLQLIGDSVEGTVYPGADPVGAKVTGPISTHGSFSARTGDDKEQTVTVSGQVNRFGPLVGNGMIVLSGQLQDLGKWECTGRWRSD